MRPSSEPDVTSASQSTQDPAETENAPTIVPFPIVGIGASAGGLEAFQQLLRNLAADTGMAFVLVQHLDPSHKSHLPEILSQATLMTVAEAADGMRIEPNHVYIIPPNAALQLTEGGLHLTARDLHPAPRLTIDTFFQSLAAGQGRLAIAVVLSGTGSDGSEGIKAIKSRCGITFAQDEQSAQYAEMPRSALATEICDYVLPPAEIAAELGRISRHRYVVSPAGQSGEEVLPDGAGQLNQIYSLLRRATRVDFSNYRQTTLRRRVGRRMLVHHCEDLRDYLAYLRQHPEELHELYKDLLINVTSFFRDPEAFDALRGQLLEQVRSGRIKNTFRAWAPGCSTGEEVYSLAMCVHGVFDELGLRPDVQFFGTDISEQALAVARTGLYGQTSLRDIPAQQLALYFRKVDGKYQISKTIRESCVFAWHDVTRDVPFSRLDLISCRNMLIYVEPVLQQGLMGIFHYALNPAGLLFLGGAESTGSAVELFQALDSKHKIFSRKPGITRLTQNLPLPRHPAEPVVEVKKSLGTLDIQKKAARAIQARYSPDCVVVNQHLQILEFRGRTGSYLEPPAGEATYDLLRMAREGLRFALRETMARAVQQNVPVEKRGIRIGDGGAAGTVNVEVLPLNSASDAERFYLVIFNQETAPPEAILGKAPQENGASADAENFSTKGLETELADARFYISAMSEDHEAALEELRSSNEELQSANEELQSANEELGTAKAELQSANEELSTVNEELDNRNHQLGEMSDDLTNLFGAVNIPILRLDRKLCLCRFTPAAEKAFGLTAADLLQPLSLFQNRLSPHVDFEHLIYEVVQSLAVRSSEMQDLQGRWWSLSVRPYRTAEDRLDGAVLSFMDINSIKLALRASQEARTYADAIVETVREPLVILDRDLKVERANAAFYDKFHLDCSQTEGRYVYELANHGWNIPRLRTRLEEVSSSNKPFTNFEIKHTFPELGPRVMLLSARPLEIESRPWIMLALDDITHHRKAEDSITHRLNKTGRELDRTKDELRALAAHLMTAQEAEQRRIARELHDDLVQRLGFLEFNVEQLRQEPAARARNEISKPLEDLQAQIASLSEVTRNISHGLHPSIIDDLGLVAALRKLAGEFGAKRLAPVRFIDRSSACTLPRKQFAAALYRIAQEAIQNASKHAPAAEITMSLSCKRDQLIFTVEDNGPGFDPIAVRASGGLGILNMEERARLLGATLQVNSSPGSGTSIRLRAVLPKDEVTADPA